MTIEGGLIRGWLILIFLISKIENKTVFYFCRKTPVLNVSHVRGLMKIEHAVRPVEPADGSKTTGG